MSKITMNKSRAKPLRNPNGFGSVYKLSGRRRRRPWVAVVTTGWTENGKQIRQIVGYFKTKQEGLDALALHRISPVSPKADMVLEELYGEWSAAKYQNISKSTADNYRAAWKYLQTLKKAKFKDIRTSHWQGVINNCKEQGLSQSTLQKIRTLAVLLSKHAMKNDIINKNYAAMIDMPKFEKIEKERFSDLEVKQIEKYAGKVPWADTILILIYTGFRISEILNLTRFNVVLDKQIIIGGSKTKAGKNRPIPIHPKIMTYIKAWYERGGEALICDENDKKFTAKRYREKCYYSALEEMGLPRRVPHACRHTFCSMLAEKGVDPLCIKELAGHAQYSFTADEYTHPDIEVLRQAISKL